VVPTWSLPVVTEVGHQQRLGVHDDNVVGGHSMDTPQGVDLLRPWEVQVGGNGDVAEVYGELIAPHREPLNVAQRFALGQGQGDVLVAVAAGQGGGSAPFVPQPGGTLVTGLRRIAHIEVGRRRLAIVVELLNEDGARVHGVHIAGDAVVQAGQGSDLGAIIRIGSVSKAGQTCKHKKHSEESVRQAAKTKDLGNKLGAS